MTSKVMYYIAAEQNRQDMTVELIASENFVSENVLKAMGSCLTNKYSEGYPAHREMGNKGRYYGGCHVVDELEEYCVSKWKKVFKTDYHVNVQPHSGTNANIAAYLSVLQPGDTVLAMSLDNGGHLSHGSPVNISGKVFNFVYYGVNERGFLNSRDFWKKLFEYNPKLVVIGASAYSRTIPYDIFQRLVDDYNRQTGNHCYVMVDMAHVAGLVAAGLHPSPFGHADIITTTTHKTLRGARGGLIFCRPELAKKVDSAVFPGTQGGPLQNMIAGKAVTAEEACTPEFKEYMRNVIKNSKAMCDEFLKMGYDVVTGGTDNHMFLLDLTKTGLTGREVQDELDMYNITLNKNCIPGETRSPQQASGVRIGTAAMTTKGYTAEDFCRVAHEIDRIIKSMMEEKKQ